ncbi:hypothetical protein MTO96_050070, partial [Rhipicephalus appendiculatus]
MLERTTLSQTCATAGVSSPWKTWSVTSILGHWPTLNRTAVFRTFFILGNVIRELGLDAIMTVRVGIDYHNSDRYLVYIGQPSFGVESVVLRGRFRSPFFRILHPIMEPPEAIHNPKRVYNLMSLRTLEGAIPE